MNELSGIIKSVGETLQATATFKKRELVLEIVDGEYANVAVFEATQDRCDDLDAFQVGQLVNVGFYFSGNSKPWNDPKTGKDRYFNSLKIANIKMVGDSQAAPAAPAFEPPPMPALSEGGAIEDSDVPF
jgi:hypothetical protein